MRRALLSVLSAVALVATGVVGALAVGGTGTVDPPPRIAFLANGIVPADALAAGGIAGQLGAPLFTTPATSLNDDAKDGIVAYAPDLVIALGGPVAINDSVLTALSAATGLPIVATTAPDDGIVRVAGGDRFATARAVAGLLAAYDPAYLPVDATALGAVDADQVDGMDADDFALSDQSCDPGEVVVEIDAAGGVVCAPDNADGGDADTLDGLDSTSFVPRGDFSITSLAYHPNDLVNPTDVRYRIGLVELASGDNGYAQVTLTAEQSRSGSQSAFESVRVCLSAGAQNVAGLEIFVFETDPATGAQTVPVVEFASWSGTDPGCQTFELATPAVLGPFNTIGLAVLRDSAPGEVSIVDTTFNFTSADGAPRRATVGPTSLPGTAVG